MASTTRRRDFGSQNKTDPASCEFCEMVQKDIAETKLHGRKDYKLTTAGKVILGVSGACLAAVVGVTTPFVIPALRRFCLPYVPATSQQVKNVLKLLEGRSGSLIDLGSGDGRIVIEAAKAGFKAEGVELNPWLVWYSRFSASRNGVRSSTNFYRKDLWQIDLSKFDNIVIFGVEQMMPRLEQKLASEIVPSSQIIACRFHLPNSQPIKTINGGIDTVWLYSYQSLKESQIENANR